MLCTKQSTQPSPLYNNTRRQSRPQGQPTKTRPRRHINTSQGALRLSTQRNFSRQLQLPFNIIHNPQERLHITNQRSQQIVHTISLKMRAHQQQQNKRSPIRPLPQLSNTSRPTKRSQSTPVKEPLRKTRNNSSHNRQRTSQHIRQDHSRKQPLTQVSHVQLTRHRNISQHRNRELRSHNSTKQVLLFQRTTSTTKKKTQLNNNLQHRGNLQVQLCKGKLRQ